MSDEADTASRRSLSSRDAATDAAATDVGWSRRQFVSLTGTLGLAALAGCRESSGVAPASSRSSTSRIDRLRRSIDGDLILPADAPYESVRRVASFNPRTDRRPAVIVQCGSAADVARALEYAREEGLPLAVRGGGHDVLGQSVCDQGVLIDLSPMHEVRPLDSGRVRVEGGARAGAVHQALQPLGLAAVLGCNPAVGIGGLILGGGFGWLLGRFGAACDPIESVELVCADGRSLRVDRELQTDLLWGLRGGGGNFGIATSFELRAEPIPRVVGGYFVHSIADGADFLRSYRDLMAEAPDELVVEIVVLPATAGPVILAIACWSGEERHAERALAPLRSPGRALLDVTQEVDYARLLSDAPSALESLSQRPPSGEPAAPARAGTGGNYWRGRSVTAWTDAAIESFLGRARSAPGDWTMGFGHHLHGAACRETAAQSCLPRPPGQTSLFFNASWGPGEDAEVAMLWVDESLEAMSPFADAGTYVNYLSDGTESAVAAAYGESWPKLRELKRRWDPDNVLRLNRNIPPAR